MQDDLNNKINNKTQNRLIVLLGRSGSGKGTQATLLKEYFLKGFGLEFKHLTTGGGFREFITSDNYTAKLSSEIIQKGELMPEFIAVWNWANIFVSNMEQDTNIILDGAPRRLAEMHALASAIKFYNFKTTVIYIDVTPLWASDKLRSRGRDDDSSESDIASKMRWFDSDVMPVINWYSEDPSCEFIHVNGEKSIEEVSDEIIKKLK